MFIISHLFTHHSRKREKEKRIILGENGEMNTIMAQFAWFHSHLRIFYIVRWIGFSQVGKAAVKNGYFLHRVGPIIRFSQILLREWWVFISRYIIMIAPSQGMLQEAIEQALPSITTEKVTRIWPAVEKVVLHKIHCCRQFTDAYYF